MAAPKKSKPVPKFLASEVDSEIDSDSEPQSSAPVSTPRIYKGTQEVDHDLFKLEVAKMRRNVSYTDEPEIVSIEHVHIFHTVDSNGRAQDACGPVGGHFHEIIVKRDTKGVPTLVVGQPRKYVREKKRGRLVRVAVPIPIDADGEEFDTHTHTFTYLGSERIKLRVANVEAAQFESAERIRVNPPNVPGVIG